MSPIELLEVQGGLGIGDGLPEYSAPDLSGCASPMPESEVLIPKALLADS
jgi:hypothetical protein